MQKHYNENMKILISTPHYYPEPFAITEIAEGLAKKGHDVTVVTGKPYYGLDDVSEKYKKIKYEQINGVEVYRIKHSKRTKTIRSIYFNYLSYWKNSKRFFTNFDEEFDVVLSFCISPIIASSAANYYAKSNNLKHVHFCFDLWPISPVAVGMIKKDSLKYKIIKKWSSSIYAEFDEIIVSSPSFKEYFENELNLKDKLYKYIPQPTLIKKSLSTPNFDRKKFHITYSGNIGKLQLVKNFVLAVQKLGDKDIVLHIIGRGSSFDEIQQIIKDKNIEITGNKSPEVCAGYYEESDALILGLAKETEVGNTIPGKLNQYLGFGKPIIAAIDGDGKKLLEDAGGSIFVNEDIDSIIEGIKKLKNMKPSLREELGVKNKQFFDKNLTNQKIIDLVEKELIDIQNK